MSPSPKSYKAGNSVQVDASVSRSVSSTSPGELKVTLEPLCGGELLITLAVKTREGCIQLYDGATALGTATTRKLTLCSGRGKSANHIETVALGVHRTTIKPSQRFIGLEAGCDSSELVGYAKLVPGPFVLVETEVLA